MQIPWLGWWSEEECWISNLLTVSQGQECAVNQIILELEVAMFPVVELGPGFRVEGKWSWFKHLDFFIIICKLK